MGIDKLMKGQSTMKPSERIKQLRKSSGLSQTKFGELFGIPMRTIQNWETGEREPANYIVNMMEIIADSKGIKRNE